MNKTIRRIWVFICAAIMVASIAGFVSVMPEKAFAAADATNLALYTDSWDFDRTTSANYAVYNNGTETDGLHITYFCKDRPGKFILRQEAKYFDLSFSFKYKDTSSVDYKTIGIAFGMKEKDFGQLNSSSNSPEDGGRHLIMLGNIYNSAKCNARYLGGGTTQIVDTGWFKEIPNVNVIDGNEHTVTLSVKQSGDNFKISLSVDGAALEEMNYPRNWDGGSWKINCDDLGYIGLFTETNNTNDNINTIQFSEVKLTCFDDENGGQAEVGMPTEGATSAKTPYVQPEIAAADNLALDKRSWNTDNGTSGGEVTVNKTSGMTFSNFSRNNNAAALLKRGKIKDVKLEASFVADLESAAVLSPSEPEWAYTYFSVATRIDADAPWATRVYPESTGVYYLLRMGYSKENTGMCGSTIILERFRGGSSGSTAYIVARDFLTEIGDGEEHYLDYTVRDSGDNIEFIVVIDGVTVISVKDRKNIGLDIGETTWNTDVSGWIGIMGESDNTNTESSINIKKLKVTGFDGSAEGETIKSLPITEDFDAPAIDDRKNNFAKDKNSWETSVGDNSMVDFAAEGIQIAGANKDFAPSVKFKNKSLKEYRIEAEVKATFVQPSKYGEGKYGTNGECGIIFYLGITDEGARYAIKMGTAGADKPWQTSVSLIRLGGADGKFEHIDLGKTIDYVDVGDDKDHFIDVTYKNVAEGDKHGVSVSLTIDGEKLFEVVEYESDVQATDGFETWGAYGKESTFAIEHYSDYFDGEGNVQLNGSIKISQIRITDKSEGKDEVLTRSDYVEKNPDDGKKPDNDKKSDDDKKNEDNGEKSGCGCSGNIEGGIIALGSTIAAVCLVLWRRKCRASKK